MWLLHRRHDFGGHRSFERKTKRVGIGGDGTVAETSLPLLQLCENQKRCPQSVGTRGKGSQNFHSEKAMSTRANPSPTDLTANEADAQLIEPVGYDFGLSRRGFVQILSAGLMIAAGGPPALAQRNGRRGGFGGSGARTIGARIHVGQDGSITVFTGKVEAGQGARAELSQAAAEELCVPADRLQLIMADTALVPDDGITAGSGSSPRTVPAIRQGAAAVRQLLVDFACKEWGVEPRACSVRDGKVVQNTTNRSLTYADLARNAEAVKRFEEAIPPDVTITRVKEWKVMGTSVPRVNGRDIVTGAHK